MRATPPKNGPICVTSSILRSESKVGVVTFLLLWRDPSLPLCRGCGCEEFRGDDDESCERQLTEFLSKHDYIEVTETQRRTQRPFTPVDVAALDAKGGGS